MVDAQITLRSARESQAEMPNPELTGIELGNVACDVDNLGKAEAHRVIEDDAKVISLTSRFDEQKRELDLAG